MHYIESALKDPKLPVYLIQKAGFFGANLPNKGIWAGQSVASLLYMYFSCKLNTPLNDFDVFMTSSELRTVSGLPESKEPSLKFSNKVFFSSDVELYSDGYSEEFLFNKQRGYQVLSTHIVNDMNYVETEYAGIASAAPDSSKLPLILINSFDLNCVQAAVCLESETLHVSSSFINFLHSRQLIIENSHTPFQSLTRFLSKKEELGAYGDVEVAVSFAKKAIKEGQRESALADLRLQCFMENKRFIPDSNLMGIRRHLSKASVARLFDSDWRDANAYRRVGSGINEAPLVIGPKYFNKSSDTVLANFGLIKHPSKNLWMISSKDSPSEPLSDIRTHPNLAKVILTQSLSPSKLQRSRKALFDEFIAKLKEVSPESVTFYVSASSLFNGEYADCDSATDLNRLISVISKHEEVRRSLVTLSLSTQVNIIKLVHSECKALDIKVDYAWGIFAGRSSGSSKSILTDPQVRESVFKSLVGDSLPFTPVALNIPETLLGVSIRELRSQVDLSTESSFMSHCVRGYGSLCQKGTTRIISLREGTSSKTASTIEIKLIARFNPDTQVNDVSATINQHRGFSNQKISEKHTKVGEQLLKIILNTCKTDRVVALSYLNVFDQDRETVIFPEKPAARSSEVRSDFEEFDDDIPF